MEGSGLPSLHRSYSDVVELFIYTIGGSTFVLSVSKAFCGLDVKQMLVTSDTSKQILENMGACRVSALRLFYYEREIQDYEAIAVVIPGTSASFNLVIRSPECERDKECLLARLKRKPEDLCYLASELQEDKDVLVAAVSWHGAFLERLSAKAQDDIDIVLAAVQSTQERERPLKGFNPIEPCVRFASLRLQSIPELILLEHRGSAVFNCKDRGSVWCLRLAKAFMFLYDLDMVFWIAVIWLLWSCTGLLVWLSPGFVSGRLGIDISWTSLSSLLQRILVGSENAFREDVNFSSWLLAVMVKILAFIMWPFLWAIIGLCAASPMMLCFPFVQRQMCYLDARIQAFLVERCRKKAGKKLA